MTGQVREITVNKVLASDLYAGGIAYAGSNLIDGDNQSWWTPAAPYRDGEGANFILKLRLPEKISGLKIWNGSHHPDYPGYPAPDLI